MTSTSTRPYRAEPKRALEAQLRLFESGSPSQSSSEAPQQAHEQPTKRERLISLLQADLNFHGEDSGYASHDLHAFAAKFPPQLPRTFIRGLTKPRDVVLDPMMGSGTTVIEAVLEGRQGIGLDIDPLALRLSCAKTMPLDVEHLHNAGRQVVSQAGALLSDGEATRRALAARFDERTRAFIDYWFLPTTQHELVALTLAIQCVADRPIRRFLELTLSSIIVTKSGGVSRARDLAHSRPHLVTTKIPKSAIAQFLLRSRKNLASIAGLKTNGIVAVSLAGDSRCMPIADGVIDLIVTSPPYANAIDYMRAHKFSLVWLDQSVTSLSKLRAKYIGSERNARTKHAALRDRPRAIIEQLAERDPRKAAIVCKYFGEMRHVLAEMYRVLRGDSAAVVVVGTSLMRGIDVQTPLCLADIAAELGFDVVGIAPRVLDRNKRMMPTRFGKKSESVIEQRIHEEHVIGLLKPAYR